MVVSLTPTTLGARTMKENLDVLFKLRHDFVADFNWSEWSGNNAAEYWNIILLITARIEELNLEVMRQHAYFS
jgi:hypothetical protein